MTQGPNPAYLLLLDSVSKMVLSFLNGWGGVQKTIFSNICKLYKIQSLVSISSHFYWTHHSCSFMYCLCLFSSTTEME